MSGETIYHVTLRNTGGFEFLAEFDDVPGAAPVVFDEPAPLGEGRAPNAVAVLSAAVGNCLAASLALCLQKSRVELEGLSAVVTTRVARNEKGRLRISGIDVALHPAVGAGDTARLARCEELFEEFCTVTSSVRAGIPVNVTVGESVAAAETPLGERSTAA